MQTFLWNLWTRFHLLSVSLCELVFMCPWSLPSRGKGGPYLHWWVNIRLLFITSTAKRWLQFNTIENIHRRRERAKIKDNNIRINIRKLKECYNYRAILECAKHPSVTFTGRLVKYIGYFTSCSVSHVQFMKQDTILLDQTKVKTINTP